MEDDEIAKTQEERKRMQQEIATLDSVTYDRDLYGGTDRDAYVTSIPVNDEDDANNEAMNSEVVRKLSYTVPKNVYDNLPHGGADEDNSSGFIVCWRMLLIDS